MLRVGLTGSIAVGKSFVLGVFRDLGCSVLDADKVARDVVEPGTVGLERVVASFGDKILRSDGSLDRAALSAIVFADNDKRVELNSIIHPLVFLEQDRWLNEREAEDSAGIAIVDAALMIESGGYRQFDALIVVWCEPELQLQRLMTRDGVTRVDAERRIAAQMPQSEKKRYADYLIDTSSSFEDTRRQANEVYNRLKLSN